MKNCDICRSEIKVLYHELEIDGIEFEICEKCSKGIQRKIVELDTCRFKKKRKII